MDRPSTAASETVAPCVSWAVLNTTTFADTQADRDWLKQRPFGASPGRVHSCTAEWDSERQAVIGVEAWGWRVLEGLWDDLDQETVHLAQHAVSIWQERWRRTLDTFIENRGRGFIGRMETTAQLLEVALSAAGESAPSAASLTEVSGSGKCALFAHLFRRLQREEVLLLAHFADISHRAGQVDTLVRRWIEILARFDKASGGGERANSVLRCWINRFPRFFGAADPLPENALSDDVERTELVPGAAAGRRVGLIDALNQFDPGVRARHLTLLPKLFPSNTRLVTMSVPGDESPALLGWPGDAEVRLPRLNIDGARQIPVAFGRRYYRTIHWCFVCCWKSGLPTAGRWWVRKEPHYGRRLTTSC